MKCEARDPVTSVWLFQLRQKSRKPPIRIAPGSALTGQLRQVVLCHPLRIIRRNPHHLRRARRLSGFTRSPGQPSASDRRLAETAGDIPSSRPRSVSSPIDQRRPLDEHVALGNHGFALVGRKPWKIERRRRAPFIPGATGHDRLPYQAMPRIDRGDGWQPSRNQAPRSPVMHHEHDRFIGADHRIDESPRYLRWVVKR